MVETYIRGREFSVGVIDFKALPVIEIAPLEGFYDYKNKYAAGSTVETCPAELPEELSKRMQQYAEEAAKSLGLTTYSRMDFLLDEEYIARNDFNQPSTSGSTGSWNGFSAAL